MTICFSLKHLKDCTLRKYNFVNLSMSKMITHVIKYYGGPCLFGKYKIISKIVFCMLSNPMMNCGTNCLNILYILIKMSIFTHPDVCFSFANLLTSTYSLLEGTREPPHDKTNKMACAPSEDSDQPGHPPSPIRVFAMRSVSS